MQFNDGGVWHDFAPDRAAPNAWPWLPVLTLLDADVRLIDHRVDRPKASSKSAPGKTKTAPAAFADGASDHDESVPPPQKKARNVEAGGSH